VEAENRSKMPRSSFRCIPAEKAAQFIGQGVLQIYIRRWAALWAFCLYVRGSSQVGEHLLVLTSFDHQDDILHLRCMRHGKSVERRIEIRRSDASAHLIVVPNKRNILSNSGTSPFRPFLSIPYSLMRQSNGRAFGWI